tara:strand:- start:533 stop:1420 length:888 start_codon:yes stop_codon:yes gene_type:complete
MWTADGIQVLLSVYNAEKHLKMCLDSLENSLKGHKWILLIGNDHSTDGSLLEIIEYIPKSTAQKVHFFNFNKANTVGQAKNKLIKECHRHKDEYPAILMMDADDQMLPERPKMLETAKKYNSKYVVGGWQRLLCPTADSSYGWKKEKIRTAKSAAKSLQFGPWATLFHYSLLPEDGRFFPEDEINNCGYEDLIAWNHLKQFKNITPIAHTNNTSPVHLYYVHSESVSNSKNRKKIEYQRNAYWGLKEMIEKNIDVIKNPPSESELQKYIAKYVLRKKYEQVKKNNQSPPHPLKSV